MQKKWCFFLALFHFILCMLFMYLILLTLLICPIVWSLIFRRAFNCPIIVSTWFYDVLWCFHFSFRICALFFKKFVNDRQWIIFCFWYASKLADVLWMLSNFCIPRKLVLHCICVAHVLLVRVLVVVFYILYIWYIWKRNNKFIVDFSSLIYIYIHQKSKTKTT